MTSASPVTVVVLGMHRSGTSLLARLLSLAGVELGAAANLAPAAADNPRGFWEHAALRDVNDALLQSFGGSWSSPPELPPNWLKDPRVEPLRARAREILERDFKALSVWGFKDPRASLVADFWQEILPGRVAWIVAVRNPLEVADSLRRRNGMPRVLAEDLWNVYTRSALRLAPFGARAILHYERLLEDPAAEIERLAKALDLPITSSGSAQLKQEAHRELRHHVVNPEELQRAPDWRQATKDLHRRLWNGEDPGPLRDEAEEPGFRRAFIELRSAYGRLLDERDHLRSALAAREQEAQQHRLLLSELLQLRHDHQLLKNRAESRMGERLRRILRSLRPSRRS